MTSLVQFALILLVGGADPGQDTVVLRSGERLSGLVIEERSTEGVSIQLPGGEVRRIPSADVLRVEYQDGTVGGVTSVPPAPPPPAPPPAATPGPGPPAAPPLVIPPSPIMLAIAFGAAVPAGDAASGLAMTELAKPQFLFGLEGGLRLTPEWMVGLVLDTGLGSTSSGFQAACHADGYACDTLTVRVGAQLRYAFTPRAPSTAWVAVGTAWEYIEVSDSDGSSGIPPLLSLTGWEYLRLSSGVDLRGNGSIGWGLYGLVGLGRYGTLDDVSGTHHLSGPPVHAWVQVGLRTVFGP